MVSMSLPSTRPQAPKEPALGDFTTLLLAPADNPKAPFNRPLNRDEMLLVYFSGRFYDRALEPLEPSSLPHNRPLVLALPPGLPLQEAMAVRSQISAPDLLITSLSDAWLSRLEALQ